MLDHFITICDYVHAGITKMFEEMFYELPVELFREDISSTEIRTNSLYKEH